VRLERRSKRRRWRPLSGDQRVARQQPVRHRGVRPGCRQRRTRPTPAGYWHRASISR